MDQHHNPADSQTPEEIYAESPSCHPASHPSTPPSIASPCSPTLPFTTSTSSSSPPKLSCQANQHLHYSLDVSHDEYARSPSSSPPTRSSNHCEAKMLSGDEVEEAGEDGWDIQMTEDDFDGDMEALEEALDDETRGNDWLEMARGGKTEKQAL